MYNLGSAFNSIQTDLIPYIEDEIGIMSEKERNFVATVEIINPCKYMERYSNSGNVGRRRKSRLSIFKSFLAKIVFGFPDTKTFIEALHSMPHLRRLCGWEKRGGIPHASTFSRAFAEFAKDKILSKILSETAKTGLGDKLVGHISRDSTAITAREKAATKTNSAKDNKGKTTQKNSNANEDTDLQKFENEEINLIKDDNVKPIVERLSLQPERSLEENLADLPTHCDWGAKTNSQGKYTPWKGYKLHVDTTDAGIPVSAVLTSASVHDSQVAIPLAQMSAKTVINLYDVMDAAYDAKPIHEFSKKLGHVPIIDHNPRRGEKKQFDPPTKIRYNERTVVERLNSDLKDNYGGRFIRVRGHAKVFTHLAFGLLAICAKQLFNMLN